MPNRIEPEVLSLAAHEFRTPAGVVAGYLRMLQRLSDPPLSEQQARLVQEAEKSCARLVALVAELSDLGKLEAEAAALTRQRFDLFRLIEEVAGGVHEARDRGVVLQLRGAASDAPVTGDASRVKAAFDAVFRAILRERPGPCTVVAERRLEQIERTSSAVVVVADEADVQATYDATPGPFDELRGGLGLALPIARRVIEKHGGRIWSPAGADGRNSAVIVFPLSEQHT